MKVSRVCSCGRVVRGRCDECNTKRRATEDKFRGSSSSRGYDNAWRKLSVRFRKHNPLCAKCKVSGRIEPAKDVHHIKPISTHPELRLDWDNLMSLCRQCHRDIEREQDA